MAVAAGMLNRYIVSNFAALPTHRPPLPPEYPGTHY